MSSPPCEREDAERWSLEYRIDTVMQSLRDTGFINYFGMQRFGTSQVGSHHVGKYVQNVCVLMYVSALSCKGLCFILNGSKLLTSLWHQGMIVCSFPTNSFFFHSLSHSLSPFSPLSLSLSLSLQNQKNWTP